MTLITIDMLQSYTPVFINREKYWKRGSKFFKANINMFGLVELEDVTEKIQTEKSA